MTRINIDMSFIEAITAVTGGNPGALRVCMETPMLKSFHSPPDTPDEIKRLKFLLDLDARGIYGPDICYAFKDINGEDYDKFYHYVMSQPLQK